MLCHIVRSQWNLTPLQLAEKVAASCPQMMVYEHVLYNVGIVSHRRTLFKVIKPDSSM